MNILKTKELEHLVNLSLSIKKKLKTGMPSAECYLLIRDDKEAIELTVINDAFEGVTVSDRTKSVVAIVGNLMRGQSYKLTVTCLTVNEMLK